MADYLKPEKCPSCGSIFVDWDRHHKVYRCLVKSCGWRSEYNNAHFRTFPSKAQINLSPTKDGNVHQRFQPA